MAQQNQNQKQAGQQKDSSQTDMNKRQEKDFSSTQKSSTSSDKMSKDSSQQQWDKSGNRDQGSGFQQQGQKDSSARQAPASKK